MASSGSGTLEAAVGPSSSASSMVDSDGRMRRGCDSDDELLATHLAASAAVRPSPRP